MLAKADKLNGLWVLREIAIAYSFRPKSWRLSARFISRTKASKSAKSARRIVMSIGKTTWLRWRKVQTGLFANPRIQLAGRKCNRPRTLRSCLWTRIRGLFVTGGGCMMINATTYRYYCAGAHMPVYESQKYDQQQSAPDNKLRHFFRGEVVVAFSACHKFSIPCEDGLPPTESLRKMNKTPWPLVSAAGMSGDKAKQ